MTEAKHRFTVITNEELEIDNKKKERDRSYQSDPIKWQKQSLKEDFMKFVNEEAGRRFSVEDLLNW